MITKPGVVVTKIEELGRVKFEPLGVTKPPLPRIYVHDCGECVYLGSLEVGGRHHDFYRCTRSVFGRTYIARYGSKGHKCESYPDELLRTMVTYPSSVAEVLDALCQIDDSEFKSVEYGFAVLHQERNPNSIEIFVSPLLEERRQIYIQDAIRTIKNSLGGEIIDSITMARIVSRVSALVKQQIWERR